MPCLFSQKNGLIMPLDQNPHQTVTRFGCINVCVQVFCAPNVTILLVYISAKIKMSFIWKADFFFAKIGIFCKLIAGPLSEVRTHWMMNWLQLLNQLNFVRQHTRSFPEHRCKLVSAGWEVDVDGFSRTLSGPAIFFDCVHCTSTSTSTPYKVSRTLAMNAYRALWVLFCDQILYDIFV